MKRWHMPVCLTNTSCRSSGYILPRSIRLLSSLSSWKTSTSESISETTAMPGSSSWYVFHPRSSPLHCLNVLISAVGDSARDEGHAQPQRRSREPWDCMNLPLPTLGHALTFVQTNILVDASGCIRLAGLGAVYFPSPASGVDVDRTSYPAAPKLIDPQCFGSVGTESAMADDIHAFGIIAWEVSRVCENTSERNPKLNRTILRSSPGGFYSPIGTRLQGCIRWRRGVARADLTTRSCLIACGS